MMDTDLRGWMEAVGVMFTLFFVIGATGKVVSLAFDLGGC